MVGKGEIAHNEIAPFPTVFSTLLENFPAFPSNLELSSANFEFGLVKNLSLIKSQI